MKKHTPVILIRSIDIARGGVTKTVLKRANTLADKYKDVTIITTSFQANFNSIVTYLYNKNILNKKVKVINFYDDLKNSSEGMRKTRRIRKKEHSIKVKGYIEFKIPKHPDKSYRYYKNGQYKMYKRFDDNNNLIFTDYRNDGLQLLKREEFCDLGYLTRTKYYNINYDKPAFEQYFNSKGKCFLSVHVNPVKQTKGFTVHFTKNPNSYNNLTHLIKKWLKEKLKAISYPIVMCEQRRLDELIKNIKLPNIKKVAIAHSTHLKHPYTQIEKVGNFHKQLFKEHNKFDKIVLLTNAQKLDVKKIYTDINNLEIIPHAYETNSQNDEFTYNLEDLSQNIVVMVARYAQAKRIDEAIKSFKIVVDKISDAKLYIFGGGPLEKSLIKLIKELKLKNNVFLMGYVDNVSEQYQQAKCSILTSEREGFGMAITESMANGTPVVSYDTKYGPSDIIENGVNGFIVKQGDQEELAERIIEILKNDDLRNRLSSNALNITEKYSEEKYQKNWYSLIDELSKD